MKLTVVAILVTFCLVLAVNANVQPQDDVDFEYDSMELSESEIIDIETTGFIYGTIKGALRSLKGINCSIKGVLNIKVAGEKFLNNVNTCGGVVSKQLQNVINGVSNVIGTANAIFTLNDDACKNGNNNDQTDGNRKAPFFKCFLKMLHKMLRIKHQIAKVIKLVKKVPDAGVEAGGCTKVAFTDLTSVFTQFPEMVKNCSKLTSNRG